jgi:hypothetical protein
VDTTELSPDSRLAVQIGGDGRGGSLYRELPVNASIVAKVTGGEMVVRLHQFGPRTRLGIIGHGKWHAGTERNEIAVLPAMGNVVEVAFVSPAIEVHTAPALQLSPARAELGR